MQKLIITVAVNGSLTTKEMNSSVPVTPQEIGEVSARCRDAGAAMIHTHARDEAG